jgi:nitroreductase
MDVPIPAEVIDDILGAAIDAPSNFNGQPWFFLVVDDQATRGAVLDLVHQRCTPRHSHLCHAVWLD